MGILHMGIWAYGHMGIWHWSYGQMGKRNWTLTRRTGEVGDSVYIYMSKTIVKHAHNISKTCPTHMPNLSNRPKHCQIMSKSYAHIQNISKLYPTFPSHVRNIPRTCAHHTKHISKPSPKHHCNMPQQHQHLISASRQHHQTIATTSPHHNQYIATSSPTR